MRRRPPLPLAAAVTLAALAGAAVVVLAKPGPGAGAAVDVGLSAELRWSDHGVGEAATVVWGQIAVTWAPEGPRLSVWSLASEPPPPPLRPAIVTAAPPLEDGCFDLAAESHPAVNALGGRYGAFALGGSTASVDQDPDPRGRRVLRARCERRDGACGLWIHLFDSGDALRRTYLDASGLELLAFWARASGDPAGVEVRLADAAWERREDALSAGDLTRFAGPPDPDGWMPVQVPLEELAPRLALDSLAALSFAVTEPGRLELEVAAVRLCAADGQPAGPPAPGNAPELPPGSPGRALWVWNTRELLTDEAARATLLEFVGAHGFDHVFLQLVPGEGRESRGGFVPFDGEALGRLVEALRSRGALTYALDGDPRYALRENHAGVLATVEALLEHNRGSTPERRLHGVRYDVEPYLLPGFHGPGREAILADFLELADAVSRLAGAGGLRVGFDVPFWFDQPEPRTGLPVSVEREGRHLPVIEHLAGLADDLGVMAYRTSAYGANGSLVQALGELEAAAAAGSRAWIGLETGPLADEEIYGFDGPPTAGPPPPERGPWVVLEPTGGDGGRAWLVPEGGGGAFARERAAAGVQRETLLHWLVGPPERVRADDLSFHRLGWARMEREASRLLRELASHAGFAGLAYHHFGSLLELEGRPASGSGEGR